MKMLVKKYYFLAVVLLVLMVSIPFIFALNDFMALQGNVRQSGVNLPSGNLTVLIYDAYSGGNLAYNSTGDFNNSIANGKYDVVLGNGTNSLNLEYGRNYFMELYVNNEKFTFNGAARQIFKSSVGQINGTFINANQINTTHLAGNINLSTAMGYSAANLTGSVAISQIAGGQNIVFSNSTTASFNNVSINGNATISGNLSVAGNISASTGFFNLAWSYLTNVPTIIAGLLSTNNANSLLVSNGTAIGYNETIFNLSVNTVVSTSNINTTTNIQNLLNVTGIYSRYNLSYESTFNESYNGSINNASYLATFNSTYAAINSTINIQSLGFITSTIANNTYLNTTPRQTVDFNGGWTAGGLTIRNGDILAQTGYFVNISGLSVTSLAINGSLFPEIGFDNTFDVGNVSRRWRDFYFSRNGIINGSLNVNEGTLYVDDVNGRVGIGTVTPGQNFTVIGTVNITNASGVLGLFQDVKGFIGIGTDTPTRTLDVRGAGNFSSTIWINNGSLLNGSTYNESYAAINSTANIQQLLNATGIYSKYNDTYNGLFVQNTSLWNEAKNKYNLSYESTYNESYNGTINNASYTATFNSTYATINSTANIVSLGIPSSLIANGTYLRNDSNVNLTNVNVTSLLTAGNATVYGNLTVASNLFANDTKVGIGTLNPLYTFDVRGDVNISNSLNVSKQVLLATGSGNVGIATLNPSALLSINGTGALLNISNSSNSFLYVNGSGVVTIGTAGKVGIGTAVPESRLTIQDKNLILNLNSTLLVTCGDFSCNTNWVQGTGWSINGGVASGSAGSAGALTQNLGEVVGHKYRLIYTISAIGGDDGVMTSIGGTAGSQQSFVGTYSEDLTAVNGSDLSFVAPVSVTISIDNVYVWDMTENKVLVDTNISRFVINGGGLVGIGTITPNSSLEINKPTGSALNVSNLLFVNATDVGIGTNNPFSINGRDPILAIQGTVPSIVLNATFSGVKNPTWEFLVSNPVSGESALSIYNGANVFMTFRNGSRIGINQSSPASLLHVTGNGDLLNISNASTSFFYVNSTNIGIGTSTPTALLEMKRNPPAIETSTLLNVSGTKASLSNGQSGTFYGVFSAIISQATGTGTNTNYAGYFNASKSSSGSQGTNYGLYTTAEGLTTNWALYSASGNNYFNGKVGVNATTPTYALEVNNNQNGLNVSGLLFVNNTNIRVGGESVNPLNPTTLFYVNKSGSIGSGATISDQEAMRGFVSGAPNVLNNVTTYGVFGRTMRNGTSLIYAVGVAATTSISSGSSGQNSLTLDGYLGTINPAYSAAAVYGSTNNVSSWNRTTEGWVTAGGSGNVVAGNITVYAGYFDGDMNITGVFHDQVDNIYVPSGISGNTACPRLNALVNTPITAATSRGTYNYVCSDCVTSAGNAADCTTTSPDLWCACIVR